MNEPKIKHYPHYPIEYNSITNRRAYLDPANSRYFLYGESVQKLLEDTRIKLQNGFGENSKEESLGLNFIKNKLETCDCIVLGDGSHIDEEPRDFIIRNLDELKTSGVKRIYLEFIPSDYSWAIDKYNETGDMSDLARLIGAYDLSKYYLALIAKCKEKGIKCCGVNLIDPIHSTLNKMNKYWADKIKETNPNNEKYILFAGSGHLSRSLGDNGIDKMLSGKIATLETVIPWEINNVKVPASYIQCGDNYSILTYKSR